ncbi:MAG: hypothetical protein WD992_00430 [Candidatus Levyibacteriota bacterium]
MVSSERVQGFNPNHTEVSQARRDDLTVWFPNAEELIREGFDNLFGIKDVPPIDIHGHDGSQATYFGKFTRGDDLYHISGMGHGEITSESHYHEWPQDVIKPATMFGDKVDVAEEYFVLSGWGILVLGEDEDAVEYILDKDRPFVVHAGTMHRVRTEGGPVLLALKTRYGALIPEDKLHMRPKRKTIFPLDEARKM